MKMKLAQAYAQQNIKLQGQISKQLAAQNFGYDVQLAEMTIEAANQQAAASGMGQIFGAIIGVIFGKI